MSLIEGDISIGIRKECTITEKLSIIRKSDHYDKAVAMSVLLYGYTILTLTQSIEKILNGNYTRMLYVVLGKFWKQHTAKQKLHGHMPLISQIIEDKT